MSYTDNIGQAAGVGAFTQSFMRTLENTKEEKKRMEQNLFQAEFIGRCFDNLHGYTPCP